MNTALKALAEPRRVKILRLLSTRDMSAGEIASRFDVTRPAISQHLAVLRSAGLIIEKRQGVRRIYKLRPQGLRGVRAFLEEVWDIGLAKLENEAEETERRGRRR
jgi:DNA-binding transcriptional ArsR family regulator